MTWFIIGAAGGAWAGIVGLKKKGPGYAIHPVQGFTFSAVVGAIVLGVPLWLLSGLF